MPTVCTMAECCTLATSSSMRAVCECRRAARAAVGPHAARVSAWTMSVAPKNSASRARSDARARASADRVAELPSQHLRGVLRPGANLLGHAHLGGGGEVQEPAARQVDLKDASAQAYLAQPGGEEAPARAHAAAPRFGGKAGVHHSPNLGARILRIFRLRNGVCNRTFRLRLGVERNGSERLRGARLKRCHREEGWASRLAAAVQVLHRPHVHARETRCPTHASGN